MLDKYIVIADSDIEEVNKVNTKYKNNFHIGKKIKDYNQLEKSCELIWDYIVKSNKQISSVRSGKQLCFKIKQFERSKTISNYLKMEQRIFVY